MPSLLKIEIEALKTLGFDNDKIKEYAAQSTEDERLGMVKSAYRAEARKNHPDKNGRAGHSAFQAITEANQTLKKGIEDRTGKNEGPLTLEVEKPAPTKPNQSTPAYTASAATTSAPSQTYSAGVQSSSKVPSQESSAVVVRNPNVPAPDSAQQEAEVQSGGSGGGASGGGQEEAPASTPKPAVKVDAEEKDKQYSSDAGINNFMRMFEDPPKKPEEKKPEEKKEDEKQGNQTPQLGDQEPAEVKVTAKRTEPLCIDMGVENFMQIAEAGGGQLERTLSPVTVTIQPSPEAPKKAIEAEPEKSPVPPMLMIEGPSTKLMLMPGHADTTLLLTSSSKSPEEMAQIASTAMKLTGSNPESTALVIYSPNAEVADAVQKAGAEQGYSTAIVPYQAPENQAQMSKGAELGNEDPTSVAQLGF